MRVLHLIDAGPRKTRPVRVPACDEAALACALLIGQLPGIPQDVVVIGGRDGERCAREAGLAPLARIAPPLGYADLAWTALRRLRARGDWTIVNCWGPGAWRAARFARATGLLTACLVPARAVDAPAELVVREKGGGLARVPLAAPVLAPAASAGRAPLRARLGIADDEVAVLLLGHAPRADAMRFVFLMGLLNAAGERFVGVLPRGAAQAVRARRFIRSQPRHARIIEPHTSYQHLLACADLAVWDAGGHGPTAHASPDPRAAATPIARAHAAGVPAVGAAWAGAPELYAAEVAEHCLGLNATLPELARVLSPLGRNAALRVRLGSAAQSHMAARSPGVAFARAVERIWFGVERPRRAPSLEGSLR